MGRKLLKDEDKAARLTITLDKETYKSLLKQAEREVLPVSRLVARILTKYFDMK